VEDMLVCFSVDVGVWWWKGTDGTAWNIIRSRSLQDFWWDSRYVVATNEIQKLECY